MAVETLQKPGSLNDYLIEHHLTDGPAAHEEYSTVIAGYRARLEEERGVPEQGLHSLTMAYDGNSNEIELSR
jgi:hypothetical protein